MPTCLYIAGLHHILTRPDSWHFRSLDDVSEASEGEKSGGGGGGGGR